MDPNPLKIWLIEDNPADVELLRDLLTELSFFRYELTHFSRLGEARPHLREGALKADVLLLDLGLPDSQGAETYRQIRPLAPGLPIVVLSGLDDEELAANLIREGAQDYLVKGRVDGELLLRTMRYAMERKKTEEELRQARDELEQRVQERTAALATANQELHREIRERLRALEALKKSERRYRLLAENVRDVIWTMDLEGRFTYVSPSIRLLTGHSPEEYLDLSLEQLLTPASLKAAQDRLAEALAREERGEESPGNGETQELELLRTDGTTVWAEVKANFLRNAQARPTGIMGVSRDITPRRQAAAALRESEATLRTILQAAPIGIGIVSQRILGWTNEHFTRMTGYSPAELRGQSGRMIYENDEEFERVGRVKYPQIMETGQGALETRFRRKDGEVFEVFLSSAAIDLTRPDAGLVFTAMDITARKQAEENLRSVNETLQALIDASPEAILSVDAAGLVQSWNPAAERIFGWREAEVLGRPLPYIPPEKQEEFRGLLSRLLRGERITGLELRRRNRDGSPIDINFSAAALHNVAGEPVAVIAMVSDITARKKVQDELRQSEARFRAIFERGGVGISLADKEGRLLECNPALERITGYSREELRRLSYTDLLFPEEVPETLSGLQELMAGEREYYSVDRKYRHQDGNPVWAYLTASLIRDAAGRPEFVLGMLEDITARKQAEDQLRKALEDTVLAMALTVETRDPYTSGHQRRVTQLAMTIGRELGLPPERMKGLWVAGSLHDLGKIYVPAEILSRPGSLPNNEFNMVKTHAEVGYNGSSSLFLVKMMVNLLII